MDLLIRLFVAFLKIGAFSFGGGYAMLPFIQREIVNKNNWIDVNEFMDIIGISQMTPGPIAINSATFVGYDVSGILGSIMATLGVVFTSFILVSIISKMLEKFNEKFGYKQGVRVFFSPGRVNLIGEHTDYNGGHVFPCALTIGTYAVVSKREDSLVRVISLNFEKLGIIEFDINNIVYDKKDDWANYPKGVTKVLQEHGYKTTNGFEILFFGNIPNGSGLSSSASLEVLTGIILNLTLI